MIRFLGFILAIFLIPGCVSARKTHDRVVSLGVYRVSESLKVGRFDLAAKYSSELTRIVPPPRGGRTVKPIEVNGQHAVILPVEFPQSAPVLIEGSEPFKLVISQNPELTNQIASENASLLRYKAAVGVSMQKTAAEVAKVERGGFGGFIKLIGGLSVAGVLTVALLCFFFPAIAPILIKLFCLLRDAVTFSFSHFLRLLKISIK